jgi:endonuclease III
MVSKKKALEMIDVIANMFPDAECELKHDNPFNIFAITSIISNAFFLLTIKVLPV